MKTERRMFALILVLLIVLPAISYGEESAKYAVIINIDGLRPDAIEKTDTPNLDHLIKQGSYTPSAETDGLAKSLPAHTSMVTGLKSANHGMRQNKSVPGHTNFPTVFSIARDNGLSTAMVTGKDKLAYVYPDTKDSLKVINRRQVETIGEITDWYTQYIKTIKHRVSLVHFPYPDIAGHTFSWMSYEYLKSIEMVDASIGEIIAALKEAGMHESLIIIITSDHGGEGKFHGKDVPNSLKIPWLAAGTNVKKDYKIKEKVYIYDTAPTVLKALGLPVPANIDGQVISEIFVNE